MEGVASFHQTLKIEFALYGVIESSSVDIMFCFTKKNLKMQGYEHYHKNNSRLTSTTRQTKKINTETHCMTCKSRKGLTYS